MQNPHPLHRGLFTKIDMYMKRMTWSIPKCTLIKRKFQKERKRAFGLAANFEIDLVKKKGAGGGRGSLQRIILYVQMKKLMSTLHSNHADNHT